MSRLVMAISVGITAFVLALTAGAVYAYRISASSSKANQSSANQTTSTVQLVSSPNQADVPQAGQQQSAPATVQIAPQDAASIAAKFINRTDPYSVELADYQGAQVFKVTFVSGDVVYVSMTGQVLGSELPPPVIMTNGSTDTHHHRGSDNGGGAQPGGSNQNDHSGDGGGGDD